MATPQDTADFSMIINPLINWFQVNVFHPAAFAELLAIAVAYLLAWKIAKRLRKYFNEAIQKAKDPGKFDLKPDRFSTIVKYVLWQLLLWPCQMVFKQSGMPAEIISLALYLVFALLIYRFASRYIKSTFWSRFVFIACLLFIALQGIGSWTPALHLLDNMSIKLGHVNLTLLGAARTVVTFFLLWSIAIMANHYLSFLLVSSTRMNYSDRRLRVSTGFCHPLNPYVN